MLKIGTTLSQRGVAHRLGIDVSTVRKRGELVKGFAGDNKVAWTETWRRESYLNGRLRGYVLFASTEQEHLSPRAKKLLARVVSGHWYEAYGRKTPDAMQELIDKGLVVVAGRVASMVACFVPLKGFKALQRESWDGSQH